jgi:hypothetical protein
VSADDPVFDPQRILEALERYSVEYVIVGGFGSQVQGATRQTIDLDLVPSTTADNIDRLAAALDYLN